MSKEKLSSDKVPQAFAEWLLSMGCPAEKVPSIDKLGEMCRGQYYMVWRSLMEHVEPKDAVRQKRLQVFYDDVQRSQKKNAFHKVDSSVVIPEELLLWQQQTELKDQVADAEARVMAAGLQLNQLVDKVSSKLAHRNLTRNNLQEAQRRAWLLQQVMEELRAKKSNLIETRSIADSFTCMENNGDIETKLDKYTTHRQNNRTLASNSMLIAPLASSSVASNNGELNESEEPLTSLIKCSGSALWPLLCDRRAALTDALVTNTEKHIPTPHNRITPQWVLSHTAGLQCTLALDAMKHKTHIKHTQKMLAVALTQFKDLTDEARELLVVRCERARSDARVNALRMLHDELSGKRGVFQCTGDVTLDSNADKHIMKIDKSIESKKEEVKRVLTSLAVTERKVQNVRECLINAFNSFHSEGYTDNERFGELLSLPQESVSNLRRFYEERREKRKNKIELSLDLDMSDTGSFTESNDYQNPKFVDELKIYLKKFNLEKNRKLVLENGEKIWVFQTIEASIQRLHTKWQQDDVTCSLVCPSVSLSQNLLRLIEVVQKKEDLENVLKSLDRSFKRNINIDITSKTDEEQKTIDKIKKRLNENLVNLQKTTKALDLGQENLKLWAENNVKNYISSSRTVDGKGYREYEAYYKENLIQDI